MNASGSNTKAASTILITGGNRGLGLSCARAISQRGPCRIILACRDPNGAELAAQGLRTAFPNINLETLELNLASLASVRAAVNTLNARGTDALSEVICNAGTQRSSNKERSEDGYELTFASNHLGHFMLVNLLLPLCAPEARLLVVSSALHDPTRWKGGPVVRYVNAQLLAHPELDSFTDSPIAAAGRAYATSKLCNLLFAYELARRLEVHPAFSNITVNAFNPGLMAGTGLNRSGSAVSAFVWNFILPRLRKIIPGSFTPTESGKTLAALAINPAFMGISGRYFGTLGEQESSPESKDRTKASELWTSSLELAHFREEERLI
jgi:NAD(P)-dependent dehydrogenase (short-subunit alcohol dehydrogenase family)